MINFIICDDNKYVRNINESIISKITMKYDFNYKIHLFEKYDSKFKKIINSLSDIKIYILDLEMPGKTGIDIAREIRKIDWDSIIIILTSHDELELRLLKDKLLIFDFISKFEDYETRLTDTINLVIKRLDTKKVISIKSEKELYYLKIDDILYIYRDNVLSKTIIMTNEQEYIIRDSLMQIISKLDKRFIRTHRACFVNKDKIKSINFKDNIIYFNNETSTDYLSRNYKKGLKEVL